MKARRATIVVAVLAVLAVVAVASAPRPETADAPALREGTHEGVADTLALRERFIKYHGVVRERAFDDLVAWMERGTVPAGDDVLAADVSKLGLCWTPTLHLDDPARRP